MHRLPGSRAITIALCLLLSGLLSPALVVADALMLWGARGGGLTATRTVEDKLSLGDENEVHIAKVMFPRTFNDYV